MPDPQSLLHAQAEWQKARRLLPWPEKLRMAEAMRATILVLRSGRPAPCENTRDLDHGTLEVDGREDET